MYGTGEGRIISVWAYRPRGRNELNECLNTLKDSCRRGRLRKESERHNLCVCVKDLDFRDISWKTFSSSAMLRCCKDQTGEMAMVKSFLLF